VASRASNEHDHTPWHHCTARARRHDAGSSRPRSTLTPTGDDATIEFDEIEPVAIVGTMPTVTGTVGPSTTRER